MDGDALQVDDPSAFHAAVGVPRIFCVKDNIGLGAAIAAVPCGGDRQRGIAESFAKNISGKGHFIYAITVSGLSGRRELGVEFKITEHGVPGFRSDLRAGIIVAAVD